MINAAQEKNLHIKAGLSLRYHPAIAKAHELFDKKRIGELIFLRCRYGHGGRPGYDDEWRAQKEISGGGELLDQGIHVVDLFNWFLGGFTEAVGYNLSGFWKAEGIEDNAFALFKTTDNKVASMHVSCTQWKNLFSFEIFGDKGHMVIEGLGGSYGIERLLIRDGAGTGRAPEETEIKFDNSQICWEREWSEFMSALNENREPLGNGEDAYRALQMVGAVYDSNIYHRTVSLLPPAFREASSA